jgi:hypothetical protein
MTSQSLSKDNFLRIGDYISLKFPKHQSFLSSEGILIDDVYVSPHITFFEEHLFQIYVQRQYSATTELEEFLEATGRDPNLMDPANASYLEALTRGKENESILNRAVMKSKTGNIVNFGEVIQLLHVKSNKFITVKPADLARDERENMKVTLSYDGSVMSYLKVMPRYKINREGEPVSNGMEILLRINERSNEYLHCADRPPPRGKFREVNSSIELPSGWKVIVFQRSDEITTSSLLLSGQLITIKDPESQCLLSPLTQDISLDNPFADSRPSTTSTNASALSAAALLMSKGDLTDRSPHSASAAKVTTAREREREEKEKKNQNKDHNKGGGKKELTSSGGNPLRSARSNSNQKGDSNSSIPRSTSNDDGEGTITTADERESDTDGVRGGGGKGAPSTNDLDDVGMKRVDSVDDEKEENDHDDEDDEDEEGQEVDDEDDDDNISLSSTEEFVRDNGNVIMKPLMDDLIDSCCVWMIEPKTIIRGGVIRCKDDRVHFRHLNSGKYLSVRLKEDSQDEFVLCLEKDPDERKTLFYISELHRTDDYLHNANAVQIRHAYYGVFLQRGQHYDSQKIYSCLTTRHKGKALSTIASRYSQQKDVRSGSSSSTVTAASSSSTSSARSASAASSSPSSAPSMADETLDIYFAKASLYHLQKYVKATVLPSYHSTSEISSLSSFWPKMETDEKTFFTPLMRRTTLFVRGYPIRISKVLSDDVYKFQGGKAIKIRRQNMLREVGVLEAIMIMIKFLQPLSKLISVEASSYKIAKGSFVEMGKMVLSECLSLLYDLIKENAMNQLYIADHLLIILSHVSTDKKAAQIAQELLSSNKELQETKIGINEIKIFTEKMRNVHMNSMYLNLLKTCCSCLGQGIPRNQEIVNNVLFHQYKDVLIEVLFDMNVTNHFIQFPWNDTSETFQLYYNVDGNGGGIGSPSGAHENNSLLVSFGNDNYIRGNLLYTHGLPMIRLTWNIRSHRFAISRLFPGRHEVLLSEVCEAQRPLLHRQSSWNPVPSSKKNTSPEDEYKKNVSEFFVSQLFLCGEMCLDRNYPIIFEMEKKYPYEMLLIILKSSNNDLLKSAAANLLHHVYINREPSSEILLPRYTRTLTEIVQQSLSSELVCLSPDQAYQFALLQVVISDHLEDIKGRPFPFDSLNMLSLLLSLVRFHYFGKMSKLIHLVNVLVNCLSRGEYDCISHGDGDAGFGVPSMKKSSTTTSLMRGISRKQLLSSASSVLTGTVAASASGGGEVSTTRRSSLASAKVFPLKDNNGEKSSVSMGHPSDRSLGSAGPLEGESNSMMFKSGKLQISSLNESGAGADNSQSNALDASSYNSESDPNNMNGYPLNMKDVGRNLLRIIESKTSHYLMMSFALLSCGVTIYEILSKNYQNFALQAFEGIVLAIFISELLFHFLFYLWVHGLRKGIPSFFSNVFNLCDCITVALYALIFITSHDQDGLHYDIFAKFFRLSRFFILYRVMFAINEEGGLTGDGRGRESAILWSQPNRYYKTNEYTLKCLVEIIQILIKVQKNLDDRSLSIFLKRFAEWQQDSRSSLEQVEDIFEKVCKESSDFTISDESKDTILMDLLMYSNQSLVQATLDLLMMNHSSQKFLLSNINKLQLITTTEDEKEYFKLEKIGAFPFSCCYCLTYLCYSCL